VVAWMGGLGIDCRCFTGFLATVLQLCRVDLAQLKASALPEAAASHGEKPAKSALSARLPFARGDSERVPAGDLGAERTALTTASASPAVESALVWRAAGGARSQ